MSRIWSADNVVFVRHRTNRRMTKITADWNWLKAGGRYAPSARRRTRLAPTLAWRRELAAEIAREATTGRTHIVLLMADTNLRYRAGALANREAGQLFGVTPAGAGTRNGLRVASAAIDAVGARILVRATADGLLEAIPFCSDSSWSCNDVARRTGTVEFDFVAQLPDRILRNEVFDSMILDVARKMPELPADLECTKVLPRLFWNCLNPAYRNPFHAAEGCLIEGAIDHEGTRRARALIEAAFMMEFDAPQGMLGIALPTGPSGLPWVQSKWVSKDTRAGARFDAIVDLAISLIKSWGARTATGDEIGAAPDPSLAISSDTFTIAPLPASSAHERMQAYEAIADFWRTARRDPVAGVALRHADPAIVQELDREFGVAS